MRMNYLLGHLSILITKALKIIQHQSVLLLVVSNNQGNQKIRKIRKMKKKKKRKHMILKQIFTVIQGQLYSRSIPESILLHFFSTIFINLKFISHFLFSSEDERPNNAKSHPSFSLNLESDIAGLRKKRNQVNPSLMKSGMGSWEVHTKGIGAKLLLQVFYKYQFAVCRYH